MVIKKGTMVLIPAEYREDLETEKEETGLIFSQIIRKALKKYFEEKKINQVKEDCLRKSYAELQREKNINKFKENIEKSKINRFKGFN